MRRNKRCLLLIINMRILIQRVSKASVTIKEITKSAIEKGLLVFIGIEDSDNDEQDREFKNL